MANDALLAEFLINESTDLSQRLTNLFDTSIELSDEEIIEDLKNELITILEERDDEAS